MVVILGIRKGYTDRKKNIQQKVYILNRDLKAGDVVSNKDLKEVIVRLNSADSITGQENITGQTARIALVKGTVLNDSMLCNQDEASGSLRRIAYTYIEQTESLKSGDCVDVRISFSNGADFILLAKKQVLKVEASKQETDASTVSFALSEEEIMRMSSGVVDAYLSDGAYIYTVQYLNDAQEESIVNYPVNDVVEELIKSDPNIVALAQDEKTFDLRNKVYETIEGQDSNVSAISDEDGLQYYEE